MPLLPSQGLARALDWSCPQLLNKSRGEEDDLAFREVEDDCPSVSTELFRVLGRLAANLTDREGAHRDTSAVDSNFEIGDLLENEVSGRQHEAAGLVYAATPFQDVVEIENELTCSVLALADPEAVDVIVVPAEAFEVRSCPPSFVHMSAERLSSATGREADRRLQRLVRKRIPRHSSKRSATEPIQKRESSRHNLLAILLSHQWREL